MFTWARVKYESAKDLVWARQSDSSRLFSQVSRALQKEYRWKNPYRVSRDFLQKKGESEVHQYGETFLKTFANIANEAGLSREDHLFELGSGRGILAFYVHLLYGCSVTATDYVPEFVEKATKICGAFDLNINFIHEDFLNLNLSKATVIYLNGVTLSDQNFQRLATKIPSEARTISVAAPFSDYNNDFAIEKKLLCKYPWGKTEVYLERCQRK